MCNETDMLSVVPGSYKHDKVGILSHLVLTSFYNTGLFLFAFEFDGSIIRPETTSCMEACRV